MVYTRWVVLRTGYGPVKHQVTPISVLWIRGNAQWSRFWVAKYKWTQVTVIDVALLWNNLALYKLRWMLSNYQNRNYSNFASWEECHQPEQRLPYSLINDSKISIKRKTVPPTAFRILKLPVMWKKCHDQTCRKIFWSCTNRCISKWQIEDISSGRASATSGPRYWIRKDKITGLIPS